MIASIGSDEGLTPKPLEFRSDTYVECSLTVRRQIVALDKWVQLPSFDLGNPDVGIFQQLDKALIINMEEDKHEQDIQFLVELRDSTLEELFMNLQYQSCELWRKIAIIREIERREKA